MAFELPPLPYAMDALQPHISKETLEYHYGKHHLTYVNNLNQLLVDSPMANESLENIILKSEGGLFNNLKIKMANCPSPAPAMQIPPCVISKKLY